MRLCLVGNIKQMFEEKFCCKFAFKVYDKISNETQIKFDISSYKMIVMDIGSNWYPNECAQFYLNTEVQINKLPYYDDCSDEGWKFGHGLNGEYKVGYHEVSSKVLKHYNGPSTCINIYNSTKATKTKRYLHL